MTPVFSRVGFNKGFWRQVALLSPSYSVSQSATSVNEGSSVTFTVTTNNVANGTVLYWTVNAVSGTINGSDFDSGTTSGSFVVTNNSGSVTVTLANDATTEGSESFNFNVRTGGISGTIVATSNTITIGDTSLTPTYAISESTTSVNEGSTVTFTITTTNVANGTTLYWTTNTVSGTVNASDFNDSATSGSFTISSNSGTVTRTLSNDVTTEGSESFQLQIRTGSISGTIVVTSQTVTINDTSTPSITVEYLVVAGGGGGGSRAGAGGGGGGGYRTGSLPVTPGQTLTITVGGGGIGGPSDSSPYDGTRGGTSTFGPISSTGGGGGTLNKANGQETGGSGGGGSRNQPPGAAGNTPPTSPPQGFPGGSGNPGDEPSGGGGGGGASMAGYPATDGRGGDGASNSITGSAVTYAGGGGGSTDGSAGGAGGGGPAASGNANGSAGSTNLGGGGGGGGPGPGPVFGGNGGSGIVIIAYPNASPALTSIGGGLSYTQPTRTGFRVYRFTAGTGNITF